MTDEKEAESKGPKKTKLQQFIEAADADPDLKKFSVERRRQLYALKLSFGNVTKAAKMLGLRREAFYQNCNRHAQYKAVFEEIKEMCIEIVEDKLMENIMAGDQTAIMYYLNCQGTKKGWFNSRKIDHTTNGKDIPAAPPQLVFVSADNMTQDQIDKLIQQNERVNSDDLGT